MSRRTLTSLLALGLALALTIGAFVVQVPYVLLRGGPTFNTLGTTDSGAPVIAITGDVEVFEDTDGRLDLTTVNVQSDLTLGEALRGWLDGEQAVVPRELVFGRGRTDEQVSEENTQLMLDSQSAATTAALLQLDVPVTVSVAAVAEDGPAQGALQVADELVSVAGAPVTSPEQLREVVTARRPGEAVPVVVRRGGAEVPVQVVLGTSADAGPPRAVLGITPDVTDFPFDVTIGLEEVGGPSAGLMFALGIVDKLTPGSLADGRYVAGTGAITDDGAVQPIGGIQQKLAMAGEIGVDVFLVPADNCASALDAVPDGLQLVRVASLQEALDGLRVLSEGGTPAGC